MNKDQFLALIRNVLNVLSGILVTHGATKAASLMNSEDGTGVIIALAMFAWSHFSHAATPASSSDAATIKTGTEKTAPPSNVASLFLFAGIVTLLTGCA